MADGDTSASSDDPVVLDDIAAEIMAQCRSGQKPDLEDYAARHPHLAEAIREHMPALVKLHELTPPEPASGHALSDGEPPRQFGDFRIVRELGRGGMGVVYHAEQHSLGRPVALKVLSQATQLDQTSRERFKREAQIAAQLHHTNIVPVFGTGECESTLYFAMQHIDGVSLDRVLRALRRLEPQLTAAGSLDRGRDGVSHDAMTVAALRLLEGRLHETVTPATLRSAVSAQSAASNDSADGVRDASAVAAASSVRKGYTAAVARIGIQVAQALDYAHSHGVLHRDIKPSNLLLDRDGTVWITDFGLAKHADDADLTTTGDLVGTLRYMPPERLRGKVDRRSDVYSLGLTLYEFLALRPAYDDQDRGELVQRIAQSDPPSPRSLHRWVPRDLDTIVMKAIAREPHRRYAQAAELADDLSRFVRGWPVRAQPIGPFERLRRWSVRNPVVATLAASLTAVLLAGLIGITWQWRRAESNLLLARESQQRAEENLAESNRQRQRAEDNFRRAQAAVDDYFTLISESTLLDVPSLEPLRRDLLLKARAYYEEFLEQQGGDPRMKAELAATFVRLGQVIHDIEGGTAWFDPLRRGLEIMEEIGDDDAALLASESWRAGVYNPRAGQLLTDAPDELLVLTERATKLWGGLVERHPEVTGFRSDLAGILQIRGMVARMRDEPRLALETFERALAIREKLLEEQPDERKFRYAVGESHAIIGLQKSDLGAIEEAIRASTRARVMFEELIEEDPSALRTANILAATYQVLALAHMRKGDQFGALGNYNQSLAILEKLARDYPAVPDYQIGLFFSLQRLGQVLFDAKMVDAGKQAYERGLNWLENRRRDYPDEPLYTSWLIVGHRELGTRLHSLDDLEAAEVNLRRAIELGDDPQPNIVIHVAAAYDRLARLLNATLRSAEALDMLTRAISTYERAPDVETSLRRASCHSRRGDLHYAAERYAEAEVDFHRAYELFSQRLDSTRPELPRTALRLAKTLEAQEKLPGAVEQYRLALELFRTQGEDENSDASFALNRLAQLVERREGPAAVAELYADDRTHRAERFGIVFGERWTLRFFEVAELDEGVAVDWDAVFAAEPVAEQSIEVVDYRRGCELPAAPDDFSPCVLCGETELELTPGDFELHVAVSGCARVWLDDEVAIECDAVDKPTRESFRFSHTEGVRRLRIDNLPAGEDPPLRLWLAPIDSGSGQ